MKQLRDPKTGQFVKSPYRFWLHFAFYVLYLMVCFMAGFLGGYVGIKGGI